jgi:hypothetical protein
VIDDGRKKKHVHTMPRGGGSRGDGGDDVGYREIKTVRISSGIEGEV